MITGYDDYYHLAAIDDWRALLLLWLQNFYFGAIELDPVSGEGLSGDLVTFLARVKEVDKSGANDRVSHIAAHTKTAIKNLLRNIHEEIIREHTLLPLASVREIDTASIIWLSRLPGRTVREKLSGKRRIKAVSRKWVQDTSENRLLKAFLLALRNLEDMRQKCAAKRGEKWPDAFNDIADGINSWLNDEGRDIGAWTNLSPNNRLLSDKHYRKIWDGWGWMRSLDQRMAEDEGNLEQKILETLFWQVASRLNDNRNISLLQIPVIPSIHDLSVKPVWPKAWGCFHGWILIGVAILSQSAPKHLVLKQEADCVRLVIGKDTWRATHKKNGIHVEKSVADGRQNEIFLSSPACIAEAADYILMDLPRVKSRIQKKRIRHSPYLATDMCRVDPLLAEAPDTPVKFSGRLLAQYVDCGEEKGKIFMDCRKATGLWLSRQNPIMRGEDIFTGGDIDDGIDASEAASHFFAMVRDQFDCDLFQMIVPDSADDFVLNTARKYANLCFNEARTLPRSIGAIFDCIHSRPGVFADINSCLVIVGSMIDTNLILTPLIGRRNASIQAKSPQSGGLFWERHPSLMIPYPYFKNFNSMCLGSELPFDVGSLRLSPIDIKDCAGKLTFFSEGKDGMPPNIFLLQFFHGKKTETILKKARLKSNLLDKLRSQLNKNSKLACFYLAADCPLTTLDSDCEGITNLGQFVSVNGAAFLHQLESNSDCPPLWRDHIPDLYMRAPNASGDLIDIPLVRDSAVMPTYGQIVAIGDQSLKFTLPAGASLYKFGLTRSEGGKNMRYMAKIKSPHFPLAHSMSCRLEMTYAYGAEEPFQLMFVPENDSGWKHGPLKTEWVREWEEERDSPVPQDLPRLNWNDLRNFTKKNGEKEDLCRSIIVGFEDLHRVREMLDFYKQECSSSNSGGAFLGLFSRNAPKTEHLTDSYGTKFERIFIRDFNRKAHWKTNAKSDAYCHINIGDKTVYINSKMWVEQRCRIEEAENVAFDVYADDKELGKYYARNIHAGHFKTSLIFKRFRRQLGFPGVMIWRDGRAINDDACPRELRDSVARFNADLEYLRHEGVLDGETERVLNLCAARMHKDGPAFMRRELLDKAENANFGDRVLFGAFLDNLELEEQERIHKILLETIDANPGKIFPYMILADAYWRNPETVHKLAVAQISSLASALEKIFFYTLKHNDRHRDANLTALCELTIALLRTRGSSDPEKAKVLDANSRICRDLAKKGELLADLYSKERLHLDTRLDLNFTKPATRASLPDILCAMIMYLSGEDGANDIVINGIKEEEH